MKGMIDVVYPASVMIMKITSIVLPIPFVVLLCLYAVGNASFGVTACVGIAAVVSWMWRVQWRAHGQAQN